ncbi:MAG: hypothetical protein AAB450_01020 [Patescibacteria group bacterium]
MSKKIAISVVSVAFLISLFGFGAVRYASAQNLTFTQIIDILIAIGVIPADKIAAARAAVAGISVTPSATSAATTTTPYTTGVQCSSSDFSTAFNAAAVRFDIGTNPGGNFQLVTAGNGRTGSGYKECKIWVDYSVPALQLGNGIFVGPGTKEGNTLGFGSRVVATPSQTAQTVTNTNNLIKVLSPNGGETYKVGDRLSVSWTPGAPGVRQISLNRADGYSNNIMAVETANTSGIFSLTIPLNFPAGQYKAVMYYSDAGQNEADRSDNYFTITAPQTIVQPSVTITAPISGQTLTQGQQYTIRWSNANLPSNAELIIIAFNGPTADGIYPNRVIVGNLSPNTTSYTWIVQSNDGTWQTGLGVGPFTQKLARFLGIDIAHASSNQYTIGIIASNSDVGQLTKGSSGVFAITAPLTQTISVTAPLAGQEYKTGSYIPVSFTWPVYGNTYTIQLRGKGYSYDLGTVYINTATDQSKNSFVLPSSVPSYVGSFNVVIMSGRNDIAYSPSFAITAPQTTVDNNKPVGYLDNVSCSLFAGWAYDPDDTSAQIGVHFYAGGRAGEGGVFIGSAVANVSRPDVNSTTGVTGNHGFSFTVPPSLHDGATHAIYAYGINSTGSTNLNNSLLTQSPLSMGGCATPAAVAPAATGPIINSFSVSPPSVTRGENVTWSGTATTQSGYCITKHRAIVVGSQTPSWRLADERWTDLGCVQSVPLSATVNTAVNPYSFYEGKTSYEVIWQIKDSADKTASMTQTVTVNPAPTSMNTVQSNLGNVSISFEEIMRLINALR